MQVNGSNVSAYSLGSFSVLSDASFEVSGALSKLGKVFFGEVLGLTGMEASLHALPPRLSMPFLHAHRQNEELYVFISGEGEFQVDGKTFPVGPGSLVKVDPAGRRSWRSVSDEPLLYLCVQAPADSGAVCGMADGVRVNEELVWPD